MFRAIFLPTRSTPVRWIVTRRIFALAVSILTALILWYVQGTEHGPGFALTEAGMVGVLMLVVVLLSFRLARANSVRLVEDLRERVEAAIVSHSVPVIPHGGWNAFDRLGDSIVRLASDQARRHSELAHDVARYRQLAEDSLGIEAYFSRRGRLLWLSPSVTRITGYSMEECFTSSDIIDLWVYAKDRPLMKDLAQRGLAGESREDHELRIQHRDGTLLWFSCRWHVHRDAEGVITGVRFSAQDIQRRKDVELKLLETVAALRRTQALKEHYLKRSNEEKMRLSSLLDTVEQGILFVDRDRRVVYINQPAIDLWGLGTRDAVVGTRDTQLIEDTLGMRSDETAYRNHVEAVVASRENSAPFDIPFNDGRIIREVSSVVPAADGSKPIGRVWVFEDVTEERFAEQRLTELAERDPLTGLYNRRRFVEEMERHLADAHRRSERVGLLSFDLDGFKAINDTWGHQAGDEVLIRIAEEIGSIVRRNEMYFRLGGDEFAILVSNTDTERMEQLARRLLSRASELKFSFADGAAGITVSVGVATAPDHANTVDGLIAAADRAMYSAKALGKNRCEVAAHTEE